MTGQAQYVLIPKEEMLNQHPNKMYKSVFLTALFQHIPLDVFSPWCHDVALLNGAELNKYWNHVFTFSGFVTPSVIERKLRR